MRASHQHQLRQKQLRKQHGERAFIFTAALNRCFGDVEREDWEWAIADAGGSVAEAAVDCGLTGVPRDAKALWGKSAEAARDTYRAWQRKNNGKR